MTRTRRHFLRTGAAALGGSFLGSSLEPAGTAMAAQPAGSIECLEHGMQELALPVDINAAAP